jgi:hypothetical protein
LRQNQYQTTTETKYVQNNCQVIQIATDTIIQNSAKPYMRQNSDKLQPRQNQCSQINTFDSRLNRRNKDKSE